MPNQNYKGKMVLKKINDNLIYRIFKWYDLGLLGVGKSGAPFVDMSSYIDFDSDLAKQSEQEIKNLLGKFKHSHFPRNGAYVPEDVNDKKWITYYVVRAEQFIPQDVLQSFKKEIDVTTYLYNNRIARLNWEVMSYIVRPVELIQGKNSMNFNNMQTHGTWVEEVPAFKAWVDSWNVFDDIGRIVVFENSPGEAVNMHRDSAASLEAPNTMHNLSIQFKAGRPTFVYDEVTKTKIHHNTKAYCFNITDNHGVDAEHTKEFTVRIDGTFKPEICEALGLTNGAIWCKDYPTFNKFKNIQIYEPEERP